MGYDLSILICHLSTRVVEMMALEQCLAGAVTPAMRDRVEILVETDSGQLSVGEKRNRLLDRATGKYVAFVDDDDLVADNYASAILDAIASGPDCVGLEGEMWLNGQQYLFCHSIQYGGWYTAPDGIFYRTPNHLNPVRRDLALQVGFRHVDNGEDRDYSHRLRPLLSTETYIDGPIYYYRYDPGKGGAAC